MQSEGRKSIWGPIVQAVWITPGYICVALATGGLAILLLATGHWWIGLFNAVVCVLNVLSAGVQIHLRKDVHDREPPGRVANEVRAQMKQDLRSIRGDLRNVRGDLNRTMSELSQEVDELLSDPLVTRHRPRKRSRR